MEDGSFGSRADSAEELAIEQKKDQLRQFMIEDLEPILARMIADKTKSKSSQPQSSASISQAAAKDARMKEVHQIGLSGVVKEMRQKLAGFTPVSPNNIQIVVEEEALGQIAPVDEIAPEENHLHLDANDKI